MDERSREFMRLKYERPMLEQMQWAQRQPLEELVFENAWENG